MAELPAHVVAIILMTPKGELIMQQRDNDPRGAVYLRNKLAFFGGHGEPGEAPMAAIIREIAEELELKLQPETIKPVGLFRKRLAVHGDDNYVTVFRYLEAVDPRSLVVHEGRGYQLVNEQNVATAPLTVFAKQLAEELFGMSKTINIYRVP